MKLGFVICSRPDSKRVPRKCFRPLAGTPLIEHLIRRCLATGYPVFLAVPGKDYEEYRHLLDIFPRHLTIHLGQGDDPLLRTMNVATKYSLDGVIRVCHDKIFVEEDAVKKMVKVFSDDKADYVFSSSLPAGASIEVIATAALVAAALRYKKVEHISYAIRALDNLKIRDVDFSKRWSSDHRLLVDFPEDIDVLDLVLKSAGKDANLDMAHWYLDRNQWLSQRNQAPTVTVYTCAYNAGKWIEKAMGSVAMQEGFRRMEYLLVDDCSNDAGATLTLMNKFCETYKNARVIRNETNLGLASSSNVALSEARAPYIIRLDADDYFTTPHSIKQMVSVIQNAGADAVYPNNYFGSRKVIQHGNEQHHVGGALFRTRAANHVKFTEGLRGYEGLDFFVRARDQIKISYLVHPTFFYRQHPTSMSKTNLEERAKIHASVTASVT